MAEVKYFTKEALDKLKKELQHLIRVERPKISKQIAEARDKGDISENAEYDAAKDAQGMLEMKIAKLQDKIAQARIIDESKIDTSKAYIYATVTIKNKHNGNEMKYTLVNETEANLREGKISVDSPIGRGLLGHQVGETVEIQVPAGKIPFEIIDINYQQ
ncbi:MAG: transcription elongation factor GreA [Bacteroidales bacterium]|nr:transcription elongation factor GreA [Bacteroidales bacterium]MCF8332738.1 transcription elongation factor GreA [Bacteroidales bacterium]